jgi:hypothetical protein
MTLGIGRPSFWTINGSAHFCSDKKFVSWTRKLKAEPAGTKSPEMLNVPVGELRAAEDSKMLLIL